MEENSLELLNESVDNLNSAIDNLTNNISIVDLYDGFMSALNSIDFYGVINSLLDNITKKINNVLEEAKPFFKALSTIEKLSESQFVYWDKFPVDFCDAICNTEDIDSVLMEYEVIGNPAKIETVIRDCSNNNLLNEKINLFNQSIKAYRLGMYEVSILGLFAVVDNVLSKTSGDINKTSMYTRIVPILDKLEQDEILDEYEITVLTLFQTLKQTVTDFTKKKDFDENEPLEINRHWLMHGRTSKDTTQLDCVKVLYFLYGILLVDEINKKAIGE